jgi:hypothetical protein
VVYPFCSFHTICILSANKATSDCRLAYSPSAMFANYPQINEAAASYVTFDVVSRNTVN